MKTVILDTNVLIDNIHGYTPWLKTLIEKQAYHLVIPTIVVAEYLTDLQVETEVGKKRSHEYLSWFVKQDLTEEIAYVLGTILRRKTYTQKAGVADLIIAATAIHLNAQLATRNKADFAKIPDLVFFKPEKLYD